MEHHWNKNLLILIFLVVNLNSIRGDRVIVVGAGISGCTAARTLLQNTDHNVTILEANPDRYGGRMWTRNDVLSDGSALDFGASWIHSANSDNPVYQIVLQLGLDTFATNYFDVDVWNMTGSQYENSEIMQGVNKTIQLKRAVIEAAENYDEDISMYDAIVLEDLYDKYDDPMQLMVMSWGIEGFWAAPVQNISAKFLDINDEIEGPEVVLPHGYKDVIDYIVEGDPNEPVLDIRLGQEVTAIEIDDVTERAVVTTASGNTHTADSVIVTVPLGILKKKNIQFSPALPEEKVNSINTLGFGLLNKFFIEYSALFWDESKTMFGVTPEGEYMSGMMTNWLNFYPISGVPVLMAFMEGDEAYLAETFSDEELLEIALHRLSSMFGTDVVHNQTVVSYGITRWLSNPLAGGSYSYATVGNDDRDWFRLSQPVCPALHFAGEHTLAGERQGRVDGAYVSGQRAAQEIIDSVCNQPADEEQRIDSPVYTT